MKIQQRKQQPFRDFLELLFQFFSDVRRLRLRSVDRPIALDRVDHTDAHHRLPAAQRRIQSRIIGFQFAVLPIPRRLIKDGCRIIPLGFARHARPCQMMHPLRHTERGKVISLRLVPAKVKIPVRNAVDFTHHLVFSHLLCGALRLLRCRVFPLIAQNIDARYRKAPVISHCLARTARLRIERRFLHHMSGKCKIMLPAPRADRIRKRLHKALRHMFVIFVADHRCLPIRQFPEHLRQMRQKTLPVLRTECLFKIIRIRNQKLPLFLRCSEELLERKLRLIRENGRNRLPKFRAEMLRIHFMCHDKELL